MKTLENLLERKNLLLHLAIILTAFVIALLFPLLKPGSITFEDQINLFILLFIQLELFIYVALKIFRGLKPGSTRKELTKTLLSRFALFMVICFIIALVVNILFITVISLIKNNDPAGNIKDFFNLQFGEWMKGTIGGLLFGAAIFIFIQWQDSLKREQKLREENLIFANETLKNQINPHFLFNNLNTLSSLITTSPARAEAFISKLSSIYRYIIENSTKDRVPLTEELLFITDYFYLYQIRDADKISMDVNIEGSEAMFILPVSLQILVENAIKHNMATFEDPLRISVYTEGEEIVVKNNLQRMATQIRSTGIGLRNLSERVRLVSGKILVIEETIEYFIVKIPLLK